MRKLVFYKILLIIAVLAFSCHTNYVKVDTETQNISINPEIAEPDSQFLKMIKPYKDSLDNDMLKVIGISEYEMVKGRPESLLSNFMADLLLEVGDSFCQENNLEFVPDMAYVNYGGIRTSLPKGEITVRKIFELMPFDNEMVFVKLKGKSIQEFLDQLASKGGDGVGGIQFGIKENKALNILIGGQEVVAEKSYWIVTNDYVASGGDGMDVLKDKRLDLKGSNERIREVIIEYFSEKYKRGELITSKMDGRIYYE